VEEFQIKQVYTTNPPYKTSFEELVITGRAQKPHGTLSALCPQASGSRLP
jgi:hypothetical protein